MKSLKNVLEVWSFVILNVTIYGLEKPLLKNVVVKYPKAFYKWKLNYHFLSTIKIWAVITKFLLPNKMKELHYKNLHMYYPCNSLLSKFKLDISSQCIFCYSNLETMSHVFFECDYAKDVWKDMFSQLTTNVLVLK